MKKLIVLWMLVHGVMLCYSQQTPGIRNVSAAEFKGVMDSLQDEVVIDLRTPEETQKGKIPGSIEIDFYGDDFKAAIGALDRNKPCLLYCAGGIRSGKTAEIMQGMGFKKIYNLEDGFNGWAKKKMPVEKK